ncbi:unnamed protein product [Paramecium sonneborni]|uniref:Uncharacterized protein n=1 Tax=Paramecium sonneborni TaxID=65129 RepID=A0A8S1LLQ7_9CILI|nr:unnamed protein product [Paramecium sonneborni]
MNIIRSQITDFFQTKAQKTQKLMALNQRYLIKREKLSQWRLRQKQQSLQIHKSEVTNLFRLKQKRIKILEEDRILLLLVQILKNYKNRYYNNLKDQETLIIQKEIEQELLERKQQNIVKGKKSQKIGLKNKKFQLQAQIDNGWLFPEVKRKNTIFFTKFYSSNLKCMKYL